ncbi:MAG TPA: response regulator [Thermoanaerobaculia bacterium]|nr:response regulator [Thermoanaerobaculia bacterium]
MLSFFKKKPRVLVLDDDVSMQKLVTKILKGKGLDVELVGHGRLAVELLQKNKYDAIVLDLMMPHEGGLTVLKHLDQHDPAAISRVIVMSASSGSVLGAWKDRIFAVVQKPFDTDSFAASVVECASRAVPEPPGETGAPT